MPAVVGAVVLMAAVSIAAAAIGGTATSSGLSDWYSTIRKPSWTPPGWLIGQVWTVLYTMIAVSGTLALLALRRRAADQRLVSVCFEPVMLVFFIHMAFNAFWSIAFFGMRAPWLAFGVIIAMVLSIIVLISGFGRVSRTASRLLMPYLAWVCFAGALNLTIAWMN
jgi:tryptophan-rich sensory protein